MTEEVQNEVEAFKKRGKKRKSFMQNAKSFARKGNFGRGTDVDQDTYNYFLNVIEMMRSQEDPKNLEEKEILANNALEDRMESIKNLVMNQVCSRAVEFLIPFLNAELFEGICGVFSSDFRVTCVDQYASHVLEKLLEVSLLRFVKSQLGEKKDLPSDDEIKHCVSSEFEEEHKIKCGEFVLKVGKFLINNLEDFATDSYANHVIRKALLCLAGLLKQNSGNQGKNPKKTNPSHKEEFLAFSVPDEWTEVVKEYAERLQKWPMFSDFPYGELTSGLLQNLCVALKYTDKNLLKSFGKKILHEGFLKPENGEDDKKDDASTSLPKAFCMESSIRLLETLLSVAGPKLLTQLNAMLFTGRFKILCLHPSANFSVQKLLLNVREEAEFNAIFDEIQPLIEEILQHGFTGVVFALAQACERLKQKQGQFIQVLQKVLKCEKNPPVNFFICVTKLKPSDVCAKDNSNFVHLHGSLVTQQIFGFNKPIKFIQNMLEVKNDVLVKIFCDPKGSHIVDAFVKSKFVGEQSKLKLVKHLEGQFLKMALSKHGSQALEVLFNAVPTKLKTPVLDELAENYNQLNGSPSGQIISKKLHIETYKNNPKRWEASFEKSGKAQELFKDILD
ncbi:nucleolar protein 9 [Culicoides brevitarsis]|uniref:nucleolar protein 9 n=1 Tax=Culicoides brevitarsis TaxID=469753 RepID=UPI00307B60E3